MTVATAASPVSDDSAEQQGLPTEESPRIGGPGSVGIAHAALADQGGDFIRAEARARCHGHGFQSMCEADYKPGRGLVGEVHAAEEGLEAGVGAEGAEDRQRVNKRHQTVTFLGSFLQP